MEKKAPGKGPFGIKYEKKWDVIAHYNRPVTDFYLQNDGPWPQPAPDNPVGIMAEVVHLPEFEKQDWKKNVSSMYIKRVLLEWPKGIWYALTHDRYKDFDDEKFNIEISEGLYSKFLTPLDEGDLELFKQAIPDLDDDPDLYFKADFSCMEPIAPHCHPGMYAAPTITLLKKNQGHVYGLKHEAVAIYLYQLDKQGKPITEKSGVFTRTDGDHWHLAKYFVLQGAVHRVNLTEHALLHFPYDPINAITKTILPMDNLLFQLLIPHLRLSLGVNKAVLENGGSLINRDKSKFYSPFCAEGKYIRLLLKDGYIGREGKPNAYPLYNFGDYPKIPDSQYGEFLREYYNVFAEYVPRFLDEIDDEDEQSWNFIALWMACIEEWLPGFPNSDEAIVEGKPVNRQRLYDIVTLVMWDLSLAHANDHIAIHNKQPEGNPFRVRVAPPTDGPIASDWRSKLVKRRDLLTYWFTDLLFYKPNNVTQLMDVDYHFTDNDPDRQKRLRDNNQAFRKALQDCARSLPGKGIHEFSRLDQISTSLQY